MFKKASLWDGLGPIELPTPKTLHKSNKYKRNKQSCIIMVRNIQESIPVGWVGAD